MKGGVEFGERTRDCSPGQAGKEGPHLAMTGASHGFPQAAAPVGVFSSQFSLLQCDRVRGAVPLRIKN